MPVTRVNHRLVPRRLLAAPTAPVAPRTTPKAASVNTDVCILVLAYDSASFARAAALSRKYGWARAVMLPNRNNPFFEDYLFLHAEELVWRNVLPSCQYVGQISYKAELKMSLAELDLMIASESYKPFDFVGFMHPNATVEALNKRNDHPHLDQIWREAVVPHRRGPETPAYFCNFWMCKRELYRSYCSYLQNTIVPALQRHPLINTDARYANGRLEPEALRQLCGHPWFTHMPFVLERVPGTFFSKFAGLRCGRLARGSVAPV